MTISDKAYAMTLLEDNTDGWTADAIPKKEIEEHDWRLIIEDDISGDNDASGVGGEE